jgi:hypothetical protein
LRAQWVENLKCAETNYDTINGQPLENCVSRSELNDYNVRKGTETYIDSFSTLFCVKLNNAPIMDYYYDNKAEISNSEIDLLVNNPDKQGFVSKMFGTEEKTS